MVPETTWQKTRDGSYSLAAVKEEVEIPLIPLLDSKKATPIYSKKVPSMHKASGLNPFIQGKPRLMCCWKASEGYEMQWWRLILTPDRLKTQKVVYFIVALAQELNCIKESASGHQGIK